MIRNRDVIQKLIDLVEKRCVLVACAGGTGRGTLECLTQLERGLTHMGMRAYDRIPVVRYNRDYISCPRCTKPGKYTQNGWKQDLTCTTDGPGTGRQA